MRASYGKEPWITLGVYREYEENGGIIKDIKGLYRAGLRNFHVEQILYKQGSSPCRVLADLQLPSLVIPHWLEVAVDLHLVHLDGWSMAWVHLSRATLTGIGRAHHGLCIYL